jgi:hypothetical protein
MTKAMTKRSKVKLTDNPVEIVRPSPFSTISRAPPPVSSIFTVRVTTQTGALLTATAVSAQAPTYAFTLGDLDSTSEFTGLFDQYRIECVAFRLIPMQNAIGLTTNSTTTCVTPYVVVDYDDTNALTSAGQARSFESCIIVPPGRECVRQFQPRVAVGAYGGATFTGYANVTPPWIDAASTTVQHYGIKLCIPGVTAAQMQLQSWTVEREYWVSFRKVHG